MPCNEQINIKAIPRFADKNLRLRVRVRLRFKTAIRLLRLQHQETYENPQLNKMYVKHKKYLHVSFITQVIKIQLWFFSGNMGSKTHNCIFITGIINSSNNVYYSSYIVVGCRNTAVLSTKVVLE